MRGKFCYTFENLCVEDKELSIQDGAKTIFLNTRGRNKDEVPPEMLAFLEYVKADLENSTKDFHDDFVRQLQNSVQKVKSSRRMEEHFMILREMLRDERAEGKAEGKAESVIALLEEIGTVSEALQERIISEKDMSMLLKWLKLAAKSESIQQFEENM